ncbi:MAG: hypothetical protein QF842_00360 [Candidatus Marinimicrobia bacterium]|nr:hypothetical protein [Candidatus Neomarinimicrobiota bacterium]MDP6610720.1 hypothetical protein [Candidatus Neomarinimicrobiota bacterium]|tara:strand:+ start:326 stop:697 length:372 start_codon:yes stop_codon:yes gene_type:complete
MKRLWVILSLSFLSFNCASNPVTGGTNLGGIYSVTVEPDSSTEDVYILTMKMGRAGRMNTQMILDRVKYELVKLMEEKGYTSYMVVTSYDSTPLLGIYQITFEVRFTKSQKEWDDWNRRLKIK